MHPSGPSSPRVLVNHVLITFDRERTAGELATHRNAHCAPPIPLRSVPHKRIGSHSQAHAHAPQPQKFSLIQQNKTMDTPDSTTELARSRPRPYETSGGRDSDHRKAANARRARARARRPVSPRAAAAAMQLLAAQLAVRSPTRQTELHHARRAQ